MPTVGVRGGRWRATVTEWGAVVPVDGSPVLDWHIAADDRWHSPEHEPAVRQSAIDGTPVVETRVRIPNGDARQRVYAIADDGGHTVVEIINESPLPIAVAFTRGDLCSSRQPTGVAIQGIDLPSASVTFPIGHHATIMVTLPHDGRVRSLPVVPTAEQVAHGWLMQTESAGRLLLPDAALASSVTAARCAVLLGGASDVADDAAIDQFIDPGRFVLTAAQLVRLGEPAEPLVLDVAAALERAGRDGSDVLRAAACAAAHLLHRAGESRAVSDALRIARAARPSTFGAEHPIDTIHRVESALVDWPGDAGEDCAVLMPAFAASWHGVDFEVHGLPAGVASTVSFAIRWHGPRPAVLWEVSGPPVLLSSPHAGQWTSRQLKGEALWQPVVAGS